MLRYTMLYFAMLYFAMLYYAMLCYTMLCYTMICYRMICYAILCFTRLLYYTLSVGSNSYTCDRTARLSGHCRWCNRDFPSSGNVNLIVDVASASITGIRRQFRWCVVGSSSLLADLRLSSELL